MQMRSVKILLPLCLLMLLSTLSLGDSDRHKKDGDEDDDDDRGTRRSVFGEKTGVTQSVGVSTEPLYKSECSSCHMLYPAHLLSTASWVKLMSNLSNHFGDDASLDVIETSKISKYLSTHSADHSSSKLSKKMSRYALTGVPAVRITETQYFKREHHEVSASVWKRKSIGSASNCVACHKQAELGQFSEDDVVIPR
ncbi:MAG: diheme cytochrome c [Proteobacteria bacterium]|nr:diheme cytochrome c [Pseudomonadota bacterium]